MIWTNTTAVKKGTKVMRKKIGKETLNRDPHFISFDWFDSFQSSLLATILRIGGHVICIQRFLVWRHHLPIKKLAVDIRHLTLSSSQDLRLYNLISICWVRNSIFEETKPRHWSFWHFRLLLKLNKVLVPLCNLQREF